MSVGNPSAAGNHEQSPSKKPTNILRSLFRRFAGRPLPDAVPAGINRRAVLGGQASRIPPIIRRGRPFPTRAGLPNKPQGR